MIDREMAIVWYQAEAMRMYAWARKYMDAKQTYLAKYYQQHAAEYAAEARRRMGVK